MEDWKVTKMDAMGSNIYDNTALKRNLEYDIDQADMHSGAPESSWTHFT